MMCEDDPMNIDIGTFLDGLSVLNSVEKRLTKDDSIDHQAVRLSTTSWARRR